MKTQVRFWCPISATWKNLWFVTYSEACSMVDFFIACGTKASIVI